MISLARSKYIRTLHDKKNRQSDGVFLVEWRKILEELIVSWETIVDLYLTAEFIDTHQSLLAQISYQEILSWELEKITTLQSNNAWLAVVHSRENIPLFSEPHEYVLILDMINDPGNLGTIFRIADWYGIRKIILSHDTVDPTSPKVIMASMGSFLRVETFQTDLQSYLSQIHAPIFGAYLDGENIHKKVFDHRWGYIVIGSEAHGIHPDLEKYISEKIMIPKFGDAESLNAWVATAVILDNIKRQGV